RRGWRRDARGRGGRARPRRVERAAKSVERERDGGARVPRGGRQGWVRAARWSPRRPRARPCAATGLRLVRMSSAGPSTADLEHSRYFLHEWMPPLLRRTAESLPPRILADLGAGDGGTLWPLDHAGLIGETIYAIDISPKHVALCERLSPKVQGIVSDVAH